MARPMSSVERVVIQAHKMGHISFDSLFSKLGQARVKELGLLAPVERQRAAEPVAPKTKAQKLAAIEVNEPDEDEAHIDL